MIHLTGVGHVYGVDTDQAVRALDGVDLTLRPGEFVVVFGHNGCGKSTLARTLNGLLEPTEGSVTVDGIATTDPDRRYDVRSTVGMVFQNPDNQIVSTVVEDDVAFGAENLGVEPAEIQRRVDEAMDLLDLTGLRERAPHQLSGGQKQRVAIAGMLTMRPRYLVLDEPTSLLDPLGRTEVLDVALRLVRDEGLGVVLITHFMDEAVAADRVLVMDAGRVVMDGTPRQVFAQVERMRALQLDVPAPTAVAFELRRRGAELPSDLLDVDALVGALVS